MNTIPPLPKLGQAMKIGPDSGYFLGRRSGKVFVQVAHKIYTYNFTNCLWFAQPEFLRSPCKRVEMWYTLTAYSHFPEFTIDVQHPRIDIDMLLQNGNYKFQFNKQQTFSNLTKTQRAEAFLITGILL